MTLPKDVEVICGSITYMTHFPEVTDITIEFANEGAGMYPVVKSDGFSCDSVDDLIAIIKDAEKRVKE